MNNQIFSKIWIIIIIAALVVGGVLAYNYLGGRFGEKRFSKNNVEEHTLKSTSTKLATILKGKYEKFKPAAFSLDSKKFLYLMKGNEEKKWSIFLNEKKVNSTEHGASGRNPLHNFEGKFSPNGESVVYTVKKDGSEFVVFNGEKRNHYDEVHELAFSSDSEKFAYVAERNDKQFVVLNGKKRKAYDKIRELTFNPHGEDFAYVAEDGDKEFVVLNGEKKKSYDDEVYELTFGPKGEQFAYRAEKNGKQRVVVNGKERKAYNEVEELTFSPKGERFAYAAKKGKGVWEEFVVLDGKEKKVYDVTRWLTFGPKGERFAYVGEEKTDSFIVLDGERKNENYRSLFSLVFGPNGKKFAYAGGFGRYSMFAVLNGDKKKSYSNVRALTFSPKRDFIYIAEEDDKEFIVFNGKEGKPYDRIWREANEGYEFSFKDNSFGYAARLGNELYAISERIE